LYLHQSWRLTFGIAIGQGIAHRFPGMSTEQRRRDYLLACEALQYREEASQARRSGTSFSLLEPGGLTWMPLRGCMASDSFDRAEFFHLYFWAFDAVTQMSPGPRVRFWLQ
jgi:hypothetical protein